VLVASIAINLARHGDVVNAFAAYTVGDALEPLIVAALIGYFIGPNFSLNRLRDLFALVAAAILGCGILAVGWAVVLHYTSALPMLKIWRDLTANDSIGVILVAPLMIGLVGAARQPPLWSELIEGTVAIVLLLITTVVIISLPPWVWDNLLPIAWLSPIWLWLAARSRPLFSAAGGFLVSMTIISTTIFGVGHFGDATRPIADRSQQAVSAMLFVTASALVLAALFAEQRRREADLTASEARLRMAQSRTGVGIWDRDVRSNALSWTRELEEIYGLEAESVKTYSDFRDRVHPDDIENLEAYREAAIRKHERYLQEFRIIRPSGEVRWVSSTGSATYDEITGEPIRVLGNNVDITERKRAEEHQKTLMAELDHRVKNVLARVAMLAASTRNGSTTIDKYVSSLQGRIQSMAVAHSLLSQSGWQNVGLGALVAEQLAPYASGSNVTIKGEDIILGAGEIQAVAMVIHELVTNAAKYGSLSVPDGRVCITWERVNVGAGAKLLFEWRELGGPPVQPEVLSGYGTGLIRNLIPHELGGRVDLNFTPNGVSCKIEIPLEQI
jgi:PAS domain S-box-containing protein